MTKKSPILSMGAEQFQEILRLTKGKKIGIVTNQSGLIRKDLNLNKYTHIVDELIEKKVRLIQIFSPEHGFRGNADAGEKVKNGKDIKTGLPIVSLYGKNKKPKAHQLKNIDLILFDLQDVGVRFYTYISTLHYIMEAAAENNIPVVLLDRPNPNGHLVDGPMRDSTQKSFVGIHPIPVLHGLTIGEYGLMINGEGWLRNNIKADLNIIKMKNYHRKSAYNLPVRPSPNLPNSTSINLYPSLCFFEGTNVSVGRGTNFPFQVYGATYLPKNKFHFTPKPNFGAKTPKHNGEKLYGEDLRTIGKKRLNKLEIKWLINAYKASPNKAAFFNKNLFFDKLAGTNKLRLQIIKNIPESEIIKSWKQGLDEFKKIRKKYLLY